MTRKQKLFLDYYHSKGCSQQAAEEALAKFYSIKTLSRKKRQEQLEKILHSNESKLYIKSLGTEKKNLKKVEKTSQKLEKKDQDKEGKSSLDKNLDKKNAKKSKGGQPTKYEEKTARQAGKLCSRYGYTDKQLADFFEVAEQTINNWKKKFPEFFESLKDSKAIADDRVEKSLYERALGYSCPDHKVFNNGGEPLVVPITKNYPPDTTAAIFWLKNRRPARWRDNPEPKHEGKDTKDTYLKALSEKADDVWSEED